MKKPYFEPEFDLVQFQFGSLMNGGDDPGFQGLAPSDPQSYGEGHGGGAD